VDTTPNDGAPRQVSAATTTATAAATTTTTTATTTTTRYIATDDCPFVRTFTLPPGQQCYSTCGSPTTPAANDSTVATLHNLMTDAGGHLADYWSLRTDMFRLRHASHFFADFNSNMDIVVARQRAFHDVTIVLGGLKSVWNNHYGDNVTRRR
jgi:hypothetical protein